MESLRSTWTDSRLDDLAHRMDDGFARVDKDLRALRNEMRVEFGSLRDKQRGEAESLRAELRGESGSLRTELHGESSSLRSEMGGLRHEMNARFDALQRTLIQFGGGLVASFLALIVAFVLTAH